MDEQVKQMTDTTNLLEQDTTTSIDVADQQKTIAIALGTIFGTALLAILVVFILP